MDANSHGHPNDVPSLLTSAAADTLIRSFVSRIASAEAPASPPETPAVLAPEAVSIGLAALEGFLQANVTGPILPNPVSIETVFTSAWSDCSTSHTRGTAIDQLRKACLRSLEVDGVSPYALVPYIELFSLARFVFTGVLASETGSVEISSQDGSPVSHSVPWMKLRIHVWHYKLLTQPSLGPGSNFTRSSQWSDVPALTTNITDGIDTVRKQVIGDEVWATENAWSRADKAQFLVETANYYILLGRSDLAKETLKEAASMNGLAYALSGALGKRTRFQENDISQLVVLAKSDSGSATPATGAPEDTPKPDALPLNNDTLLEEIHFTKDDDAPKPTELPSVLADLSPNDQPQLSPLDQIILLTEATIKDAFSPADTLTSSEVLPFAVRVLTDKSTNWQIYTQALLVRSRIEIHRSRTIERGVLQMQAVADQVLTDTTAATAPQPTETSHDETDVPAIQVTAPNQTSSSNVDKPTSFLPAPKASESAPAHLRLRYIHALSSPPRWHLEAELAYAWAGVGSLTSALEIFKRLHLWAEVALCLASTAALEDDSGRGKGGEEKARGIIRWRLFHRTGTPAVEHSDPDDEAIEDVTLLRAADFSGPERTPPPPNAARLWCILGDMESSPAHYTRAWDISQQRYARAQKSLGEHYLQKKDWLAAQEAYTKATRVNRLSPEMWGRLGDISLRLGAFDEAAQAYSRSIGSATDEAGGEGARTWSNLGSALWSRYIEIVEAEAKAQATSTTRSAVGETKDEAEITTAELDANNPDNPSTLLIQALAAYKKGASIAHSNWRIWDNVLTLASRIRPPAIPDMVQAMTHVLRIRATEDALDTAVLAALLNDAVLTKDKPAAGSGIYDLPRGSTERLVARLLEEEIVPLITRRAELWMLVSRLRAWRRDYAGSIDAAERAWRATVGASGSGLTAGAATSDVPADWTVDETAWEDVVRRTDELVSVLENWGPQIEGGRWRGKARSAVRSVMGRGREQWEGSEGWTTLEGLMAGLKVDKPE